MTADQATHRFLDACRGFGRDNRAALSMCDALHHDLGLDPDDMDEHRMLHHVIIGSAASTMATVGMDAHPEAVAYLLAVGRRMGMAEAAEVLRSPIELD